MTIKMIADCLNGNPAGIGRYTRNLVSGLRGLGWKIDLVNYAQLPGEAADIYGNPLRNLPLKTYSWHFFLPRRIRHEPNTIVHNPSQIPSPFRWVVPAVFSVCDMTPFLFAREHRRGKRLIYAMLLGSSLRHATRIITISQNTKNDLLSRYAWLDADRVRVAYCAADESFHVVQDTDRLRACTKKYSLPPKFILCVGTLEPRKNLPRLLEAFSQMAGETDVSLVITGGKGWKYQAIFDTCRRLGLEERVVFTGYVDDEDLPTVYNLAEVFVYPSLYEGFGLPPLEAMQCSCPVIVSNTSSLPEVCGKAARYVDPHDTVTIADTLAQVLSDPEEQRAMAARGLEQARQFSWESCARETAAVYEEIIGTS